MSGATSGSISWRSRLEELIRDYLQRPRPASAVERARAARAWQSELVDAGVAAPGWPKEVGGLALDLEDQLDYYKMTSAAGVPKHPNPISMIVAPTLIVHGTASQKARFLEPLLRADELWCQGFSEPGAGSDLASLATRAIRDGDNYRITGQKIWTTRANLADWMFALVRTGMPGRGAEGISYILISMKSRGVEVRPLRDAAGGEHFSEVFLDDVVVPRTNLVGEEGGGWSVMRTSLGHERATAFLADEFRYRGLVDKVFTLADAQGYSSDALVRQELAMVETGVRAIAANSAQALGAAIRGDDPGGVASVNRLVKSEFEQRLHRLAQRLTGTGAALGSRSVGATDGGRWTYGYLMTRASTIGAGTAEMQRNTIAEQVLGLPSHRGEGIRPAAVPAGSPLADPSEDESALRTVLRDVVSADGTLTRIPDFGADPGDHDTALWDELVQFGLPGLAVDETAGGGGASVRTFCVAVEQVAFGLASVPLVPTAITLEIARLARADNLIKTITEGATAAFVASVDDDGWVCHGDLPVLHDGAITGSVERVAGAPAAKEFVVLAEYAETGELAIASVSAVQTDVIPQHPLDITGTIGIVRMVATPAVVHARGADAERILRDARPTAQLILGADSVGLAARALAMSVRWAGEREQFGRLIGSFQAISHKCANMLVAVEGARNQVLAAAEVPRDDPDSATWADLAVASALDAGVNVAEECMQIHGGIGFTWEHPTHVLLRRAASNQVLLGRPEKMRDRAAVSVLNTVAAQGLRERLPRRG